MQVISYLNLQGRAEEAIEFYKTVLGAEVVMMMRFKDMPPQDDETCQMPPELDDKIMHATLMFGETTIMISDSAEPGHPEFKGISLSIALDDMDQAEAIFAALAEEGEITMPLASTFWAKAFGMVNDKFGISWMINLSDPEVTE